MNDASRDILALLRQAQRKDPGAFDRLVRQYVDHGDSVLTGGRPGRRPRVTRNVLALLLADVENAIEDGISEREKLRRLAEQRDDSGPGCRYGPGDGRQFRWLNANTIKSHVHDARECCDDDSTFREHVDFYRSALRTLASARAVDE